MKEIDFLGKRDMIERLKKKAEQILSDRVKLESLLQTAQNKAKKNRQKLESVWQDFSVLLRILKSWMSGDYTAIPWKSLSLVAFAVLYFVIPTDFIPDFVFAVGLLDDIAIIGMVIRSIKDDIDLFLKWEAEQNEIGEEQREERLNE